MKKSKFIIVFITAFLFIFLCACAENTEPFEPSPQIVNSDGNNDNNEPAVQGVTSGEIVITFDYEKIPGVASNQFAVWVEDMNGNYINTIYATQWTANGGYKNRPDSVAMWVEKSGIASMPDYYVDAIAGATPKVSGSQSYAWNLKDINGSTVSPGEYKFFVEGSLRWKNYVLYSGVITIGDEPVTVQADVEFVYEKSNNQAALTDASPENAMIGAVTASFTPIIED